MGFELEVPEAMAFQAWLHAPTNPALVASNSAGTTNFLLGERPYLDAIT